MSKASGDLPARVGRPPDPQRRTQLLEGVVDYVLAHGLAELSLRPLASALRTSPRILLYHFGSKEQLVTEALRAARAREQTMIGTWWAETPPSSPVDLVWQTWQWMTDPEHFAFLRLFFEVYGLALQEPDRYRGFLDSVVGDWLDLFRFWLEDLGMPEARSQTVATWLVAGSRGLLLDLLATDDRPRVDAAFADLVDQLASELGLAGRLSPSSP